MRLGNLKKIFSDLKLQSDKSFLPLEIKNLNYSIGSKEILYNLNIKIISVEGQKIVVHGRVGDEVVRGLLHRAPVGVKVFLSFESLPLLPLPGHLRQEGCEWFSMKHACM